MDQSKQEITQKVKGVSLRLVLLLLLFAIIVGILYYITDEIVLEKKSGFDTRVFEMLSFIKGPSVHKIMLFFTFFGSTNFLLPAYILISAYFLFIKRKHSYTLNVAAVGISSGALLYLLKGIFKRQRPAEQLLKNVAGYSYPSGHSFSSFTFCGMLIYLVWQSQLSKPAKWVCSIFLFLFAATIAFSRVYFRVHYPSDVLAGFCLSIIWLTICYFLLIKWNVPGKLNRRFATLV
jgi:undecaprenyl-diphosphatase